MGERNHPRSRRSGSDVTDARVRRENASKGCPTTGKRFRACVHRTSRHAHPNREMDDCGQDTIPRCGNRLGRLTAHKRAADSRSEEHTSELQSHSDLVCRLLLEKKKKKKKKKKKYKNKKSITEIYISVHMYIT